MKFDKKRFSNDLQVHLNFSQYRTCELLQKILIKDFKIDAKWEMLTQN